MIRRGGSHDVRFLRDLLRHAYYWRMPMLGSADLPLSRYVDGWGRPGDASVIAIDDALPVGAAWYRLFPSDAPGYGFVDESTPELTIAVVPHRRGRGYGRELMEGLLEHARKEGYAAISLSAEERQIPLYERYGFRRLREDDGAWTMAADLRTGA